MPIPSEERWKNAEKKRIAGVIRRRQGLPEAVHYAQEGSGAEKMPTTMFDQVITVRASEKGYYRVFSVCTKRELIPGKAVGRSPSAKTYY